MNAATTCFPKLLALACASVACTALAAPPVSSENAGERTPGSEFSQPATMTIVDRTGTISSPVFAVKSEFATPVDVASGLPSGRAAFHGLTITRDVGANSGRLFADYLQNVDLDVTLVFSTNPAVSFRIERARITTYRTLMSQRPGGSYAEIEEIGLNFATTFKVDDGTTTAVFDRALP